MAIGITLCTYGQVVTTTADSGAGSLRDIIANASNGDVITFDISIQGQTITLTSPIIVDIPGAGGVLSVLQINGNNGGTPTTISGGGTSRIFEISTSSAMVGTYTINDIIFDSGASSGGQGGAITVSDTATTLSLVNTSFTNNTAAGSILGNGGGAIVVVDASLNISGTSIFSSNTASIVCHSSSHQYNPT